MNLNLELRFNPSCSLLKYQKERRFAILTIKTGRKLLFKRVLKISCGCPFPSLICPCSEADFISSVQPFPSAALETSSALAIPVTRGAGRLALLLSAAGTRSRRVPAWVRAPRAAPGSGTAPPPPPSAPGSVPSLRKRGLRLETNRAWRVLRENFFEILLQMQ